MKKFKEIKLYNSRYLKAFDNPEIVIQAGLRTMADLYGNDPQLFHKYLASTTLIITMDDQITDGMPEAEAREKWEPKIAEAMEAIDRQYSKK